MKARSHRTEALRPDSRHERAARSQGSRFIAGVDEVGRGCLFGPVVAAAVILDPAKPVQGLDDSKKLDPARRERLDGLIRERAVAWAIAAVDAAWIDRLNIYQATRRAMLEAVRRLVPAPDHLLVDAMRLPVSIPQLSLVQGDARCRSIAAASIIAKVERDRWMAAWSALFPQYGLASNKGYGTRDHLAALERYGPSTAHRFSFAPVALAARTGAAASSPARQDQIELFFGSQGAGR
jgi:ribonuclease HII